MFVKYILMKTHRNNKEWESLPNTYYPTNNKLE